MSKIHIQATSPADHFTVFANELFRNPNMRALDTKVLMVLLSLGDGWFTSTEYLARKYFHEGRDAVRGAVARLEGAGYVERRRRKDPNGHWVHEWDVQYPAKQADGTSPSPENTVLDVTSENTASSQVSPTPENPATGSQAVSTEGTTEEVPVERTSEWSGVVGGASAASMPAQQAEDQQAPNTSTPRRFTDWRTEDEELFRQIIGEQIVVYPGGGWRPGTYSVKALYDALQQHRDIDWPGMYVSEITGTTGVYNWLENQGIEVVA